MQRSVIISAAQMKIFSTLFFYAELCSKHLSSVCLNLNAYKHIYTEGD